ncbi:hypothetical protein M409DRAFT_27459 [Zasmidium cellare ATCC 36951]|uniref:Uncharacterized protein n=1 Tax=Zasmidium cellare ATCC 36951 TaxID=1080233 RepID=A0A6A6C4X6_ZASCE|nr:uncharacterized protein M409DRAFT_27459 [Zasmidium cellare ATCC 36951]KAF2162081.1 hypothetical protein M409DRAFT_27459 [Zasmidium cellare ATCC 36951]
MNPALNPLLQHAMMAQTGLPLGRRANGFGALPLGPGVPIPAHQLNFLSGQAGMLPTPFSAGRYPFPQTPMPMQPINPMMMGMMGGGGGRGGMMGGAGGGGGMMGGGAGMNMNPLMLAYLQQLYLEMLLSQSEDPDDTGVWDGDDEEGADVLAKMRRRRGRRGGAYPPFSSLKASLSLFAGLGAHVGDHAFNIGGGVGCGLFSHLGGMGMGMGMSPFGMAPLGIM